MNPHASPPAARVPHKESSQSTAVYWPATSLIPQNLKRTAASIASTYPRLFVPSQCVGTYLDWMRTIPQPKHGLVHSFLQPGLSIDDGSFADKAQSQDKKVPSSGDVPALVPLPSWYSNSREFNETILEEEASLHSLEAEEKREEASAEATKKKGQSAAVGQGARQEVDAAALTVEKKLIIKMALETKRRHLMAVDRHRVALLSGALPLGPLSLNLCHNPVIVRHHFNETESAASNGSDAKGGDTRTIFVECPPPSAAPTADSGLAASRDDNTSKHDDVEVISANATQSIPPWLRAGAFPSVPATDINQAREDPSAATMPLPPIRLRHAVRFVLPSLALGQNETSPSAAALPSSSSSSNSSSASSTPANDNNLRGGIFPPPRNLIFPCASSSDFVPGSVDEMHAVFGRAAIVPGSHSGGAAGFRCDVSHGANTGLVRSLPQTSVVVSKDGGYKERSTSTLATAAFDPATAAKRGMNQGISLLDVVQVLASSYQPSRDPSSAILEMPGGPWSAKFDSGQPSVDDCGLVRACKRHARENLGLDLEPCVAWVKLQTIVYHRPQQTSKEELEVVSIFLVADAFAASRLYSAKLVDSGASRVLWTPGVPVEHPYHRNIRLINQAGSDVAKARFNDLRASSASKTSAGAVQGSSAASSSSSFSSTSSSAPMDKRKKGSSAVGEVSAATKNVGKREEGEEGDGEAVKADYADSILPRNFARTGPYQYGELDINLIDQMTAAELTLELQARGKLASSRGKYIRKSILVGLLVQDAELQTSEDDKNGAVPRGEAPSEPSGQEKEHSAAKAPAPSSGASSPPTFREPQAQVAGSSTLPPHALPRPEPMLLAVGKSVPARSKTVQEKNSPQEAVSSSAARIRHRNINLRALTFFDPAERDERTFEANLCGIALRELLARDCSGILLAALVRASRAATCQKDQGNCIPGEQAAPSSSSASSSSSAAMPAVGDKRKQPSAESEAAAPAVSAPSAKCQKTEAEGGNPSSASGGLNEQARVAAAKHRKQALYWNWHVGTAWKLFDVANAGWMTVKDVEQILSRCGASSGAFNVAQAAVKSLVARVARPSPGSPSAPFDPFVWRVWLSDLLITLPPSPLEEEGPEGSSAGMSLDK